MCFVAVLCVGFLFWFSLMCVSFGMATGFERDVGVFFDAFFFHGVHVGTRDFFKKTWGIWGAPLVIIR